MLDLLLRAMQNHHAGILAPLKRALRNQFPWQTVIVIAESYAHRSIEVYCTLKPSTRVWER
jgi:hypothetical protein